MGIDQLRFQSVQLLPEDPANGQRRPKQHKSRKRIRDLECTIVYVRCDSGYDGYHETHLIVTVHSELVPSRLGRQNEDKTLTTTNWFFQALSVIPRGSWGDVVRRFTMIRWESPSAITARWFLDTTNQSISTPMIALYLSGTTHLSVGHNVALSQYATSTDLTRHRNYSLLKISTSLVTSNTSGTSLELKFVKDTSYLSSQLNFSSLIPTVRTHFWFYLSGIF
ncbi:hypothetical protein F511_22250 [Dorcoceras hygrometricum]|uniref:Uncharacterized protein n=1 Tax=Dorcoceras hygrometricum TaxID=472368 RepID=A0A2Z7BV19_9LAMI|nr:hypothetical protein F511_22250 [Dorcoceras hygrometricum]